MVNNSEEKIIKLTVPIRRPQDWQIKSILTWQRNFNICPHVVQPRIDVETKKRKNKKKSPLTFFGNRKKGNSNIIIRNPNRTSRYTKESVLINFYGNFIQLRPSIYAKPWLAFDDVSSKPVTNWQGQGNAALWQFSTVSLLLLLLA